MNRLYNIAEWVFVQVGSILIMAVGFVIGGFALLWMFAHQGLCKLFGWKYPK